MIKKFIDKLLGKSTPGTSGGKPHFGKREEVPASVHGINPELAGSLWTTGEDYNKFLEEVSGKRR